MAPSRHLRSIILAAVSALVVADAAVVATVPSAALPSAAGAPAQVATAASQVLPAGQVAALAKQKNKKKRKARKARSRLASRSVSAINSRSFGIHTYQGKPEVPSGSIRLACSPPWEEMHPAPGVFVWGHMDAEIARVKAMGYTDILVTFCRTPGWAVSKATKKDVQPPDSLNTWRAFVRAFVARYRADVDSYEVWNEATSPAWWRGTPAQLATMTQIANDIIGKLDPSATVISATSQCCENPAWWKRFFPAYMRELAKRRWPVDVIGLHTYAGSVRYSSRNAVLNRRAMFLRTIVTAAARARVPRRLQLWDTETNMLVSGADATTQQAVLARTFLDSWRYGLPRTYWYIWTQSVYPWVGVQLMPNSPATVAFRVLSAWTMNSRLLGCPAKGPVVTCNFARGRSRFTIAYTVGTRTSARLALRGRHSVCPVSGSSCRTVTGPVSVGVLPVRIG